MTAYARSTTSRTHSQRAPQQLVLFRLPLPDDYVGFLVRFWLAVVLVLALRLLLEVSDQIEAVNVMAGIRFLMPILYLPISASLVPALVCTYQKPGPPVGAIELGGTGAGGNCDYVPARPYLDVALNSCASKAAGVSLGCE